MKLLKTGLVIASVLILAGCIEDDATIVEANMVKAADNFELNRRITFNNDYTNEYLLLVEGRCSMDLNSTGTAFNVICKMGPDQYKRHTQVLSNMTSATVEQLDAAHASAYHYRVIYKPQSILPDVDLRVSGEALVTNSSEANQ